MITSLTWVQSHCDRNRQIPLNPAAAGHPAAGGDVDADPDADAFVRAPDAGAAAGGGAPRRPAAAHHTAVLAGAANHTGEIYTWLNSFATNNDESTSFCSNLLR